MLEISRQGVWKIGRCWWMGVMLIGICFGTLGLGILGSAEGKEGSGLSSNGNSTGPWLYFTVYTIGVVFLSYYLGGIFNSHLISEDQFTSNSFLKLKSQLTLLPISQFIRKHGKSKKCLLKTSSVDDIKDQVTEQRDLLIDAILDGYVFPWYHRISDERMFPMDSKHIFQLAFNRLRDKIKNVNRTTLAMEGVEILHCHWNEYCIAINKIKNPNELLIHKFKLIHPYMNNREEVTKQYESLISLLLPELLPQDLHSQLLCKFLSGILVKGIFLYYAEVMSDPKWVNTMLVTLISAGHYVNTYETSSNQSGSNLSTAPPSPSPTLGSGTQFDPDVSSLPSLDDRLIKSPDTLMEESLGDGISTKGSIQPLLTIETTKQHFTSKKDNSNPVMNSIQTALSGLLSATALPLLPDGSSYIMSDTTNPSFESEKSPLKELLIIDEDLTDSGSGCHDNVHKDMTIRFSKERPTPTPYPTSPSTRHKSWEESRGSKSKSSPSTTVTTTKSLDESSTSHSVSRQSEFEFGGKEGMEEKKMEPSPMYEEPEDFAATIAKLRSLLEQRQSQTNVIEEVVIIEEKKSTTTGDGTTRNHEGEGHQTEVNNSQAIKTPISKVRPSLDSQSSASSLTSDSSGGSTFPQSLDQESKLDKIDDDEEEVDPVISRFFLNVSITKTEACGDSSDNFTLYCIQYEGVYIEEEGDEGLPKLVLRTTTVKRSFKEFLLLQSQLEVSPIWRPHLRGIKTPNKWLNLSFSNHNSGNHRRLLLERYLQQVSSHPVLGFCPELRHFMAYGDDGFQMFGLPPFTNTHLPRFDKLTKTFTGVLNSLRDALPSFESELQGVGHLDGGNSIEFKGKKLLPSFLQFGDRNTEEELKSAEAETSENVIPDQTFDPKSGECDEGTGSTDGTDSDGKKSRDSESDDPLAPNATMKTNEHINRQESSLDSMYPLASSVTKLLCDVLWLPHQRPHSASVSAVMSVSGKSLENYLQESLDIVLSEEAFLGYLEWLTTSVREWTVTDKIDSEKEELFFTVEDLKLCLKQRVPIWVRWMWGRSRLDLTIDRLAEFFQISLLNHDFILSIVELVFSKLTTSTSTTTTDFSTSQD